MKLLLDTCAVLYFELEPEKLGDFARAALSAPENEIFVSAVTIGEIACLSRKKIQLKKHWKIWMNEAVEANGWDMAAIDREVIEEAYSLPEPFHRDPADRILVATSRIKRIPLVTNDTLITNYPHVNIFW